MFYIYDKTVARKGADDIVSELYNFATEILDSYMRVLNILRCGLVEAGDLGIKRSRKGTEQGTCSLCLAKRVNILLECPENKHWRKEICK
jgi:hypothetical protein